MKKLFILFSFCLLLLSGGCSDDDKEISPEDVVLNQTVWKGTFHKYEYSTNDYSNYDIIITFSSVEGGYYQIKPSGSDNSKYEEVSFDCRVDEKIIHIYGYLENIPLAGFWWITYSTHNKLTLKTSPETTHSSTLSLTKVL
ncbi:MAG: hypothetical protein K2K64_11315 [Muribaculaceae bacterium]|nr:hypothetical protein [Muribaculaceae bacterium]